MNRLAPWELPHLDDSRSAERGAHPTCRSPRGTPIFSVVGPLHYESNYAYPLIVWLHAHGGDHRDLQRVLPLISLRNYVAVAPRGAATEDTSSAAAAGYTWWQSPGGILQAQDCIVQSIADAARRYHVHADRVFLAGYGAGGSMALRVAMSCPARFAGAASLGGPFPSGHMPLHNVENVRGLPLLLAHGRASQRYSEQTVCSDLRLLHAAGVSVTLRQYPAGDELTSQMLHDLNVWMMEIVTGPQPECLSTTWPPTESLN